MKVIFLSPAHPFLTAGEPLPRWQTQASWVRALEKQGHEVGVVKYTPDDRIRLNWGERVWWNLRVIREIRPAFVPTQGRDFGEARGADLIIYSLGADVLFAQTLKFLKNDRVKLVVLSGVSPVRQGNPRERATAKYVDLAATNDEYHAREWLELGVKRATVLPIAAADPELHWERRENKDIDVLFIGTLTEERRRFFDELRRLLPQKVKIVVKEFVWEEEYAGLMSRAKIGINLLRPEMKRGVNLRAFEIPAFGAMEITNFSRPEWLAPGREVEVFGSAREAAELVKKYLADEKARVEMAERGRRRVMREHTFDERAKKLMKIVGVEFDKAWPSVTKARPLIDVSVCIVNYKADEELKRCVASIKKFTKGMSYEIIVIDNSVDNRWYSGGNNLALKSVQGKYILFLNPDCWLKNDAVSDLVRWMDKHTRVGVAEPRQAYETGEIAPTGSLAPKWWIDTIEMTGLSGLFGRLGKLGILGRFGRLGKCGELDQYRQIQFDRRKNWQTEVVSGAAMMVRKEIIDEIGGFDERLKLYYTDVDLCRRIRQAGWQIWHVGEIWVGHRTRVSTSKLPWERLNLIYAEDGREYYRKWRGGRGGEILYWMMKMNTKIIKDIK